MGHQHQIGKSQYEAFADRLNLFPQGAPPTETWYKILRHLFTEREAGLLAQVPLRPFTADKMAKIWGISGAESERQLTDLAERGLILDMEDEKGERVFVLPPPIVGFLEFTLMRTRGDIDQKLLSELYHHYLMEESDFAKDFFFSTVTRVTRTFVSDDALSPAQKSEILDYESALATLKDASHIGVSMCFCRHKAMHQGTVCKAPMDVCLCMNTVAQSLSKHGYARLVDYAEAADIIALSRESHLVHVGDNVQEQVGFICNCCGCCCELLTSAKRFGKFHPVATSNYMATINAESCVTCGKCVKVCPINAIRQKPGELPKVNERTCLGCGVCAGVCPKAALTMKHRGKRIVTPINIAHRLILQAVEKGTLQHLIFDTKAYASHRTMGTILGVILNLSPIKAMLAGKLLHSKFIEKLISDKQTRG